MGAGMKWVRFLWLIWRWQGGLADPLALVLSPGGRGDRTRILRSLAVSVVSGWVLLGGLAAPALADPSPTGNATLVVITGIGGEPRFDERFHAWAATLMDAASGRFGLPSSSVVYLAADPERDPGRARARSTRANVQATLRDLVSTTAPEDPLILVVIGHGSHREGVSKVNLPGPDMTAAEFAAALEPFGERKIAFANLTSASGEFLPRLSAPGRVVITATRSGRERNTSIFAQFFVAAFVGDEADLNHDSAISLLEAFNYARAEVERAYERDQKILTEHAVLDDNGDGEGSDHPTADGEEGRLAATLALSRTGLEVVGSVTEDPEVAKLIAHKQGLETSLAELRKRKASLSREDYENRLEELLIELATTNRSLRDGETGSESP